MNRFGSIGVWVLIAAAAVLLPMYELADYSEVWPQDQNFIIPAIVLLFIGMALLSVKLAVYIVLTLTAVLAHIFAVFKPRLSPPSLVFQSDVGPPLEDLPFIFCDLRL